MCEAVAAGAPPVPRRIGSIGSQEFGQELGGVLAGHRRGVGAESGGSATGQHLRNRRRRFEGGAGAEAGQDEEGKVVDDIIGRVGLHCCRAQSAVHGRMGWWWWCFHS